MKKKIIPLITTLFLVINTFSIFANEEPRSEEDQTILANEEQVKQEDATILTNEEAVTTAPKENKGGTPRAIVQNGTIGTVDWTLDDAGVLTYGGGVFADDFNWTAFALPFRDSVKTVTFTEPVTAGNSLRGMFVHYENMTTINGLEKLDTSNVTDMTYMFRACKSLETLDLRSFDTRNVQDFECMFDANNLLRSIDLSSFDTSSATDMYSMFSNCFSLKTLDLSSFDISNVLDMRGMFQSGALESLDISSFNTSNTEKMLKMFRNSPIRELKLGSEFRFKYDDHYLGAPVNDLVYTGNWKMIETGEILTQDEFLAYDGTAPGTYVWQKMEYNLTYKTNGGSPLPNVTIENGDKITEPTNPTKEGYTFDGWYKDIKLLNEWDFQTDIMPTRNMELYAKWRINTYDVTYDTNGGSGLVGQTADYNTVVTRPTNPTKEGYTFGGWYKEAGLLNEWDFQADLMPANNITLYAKWNVNTYDVTYNSNGGDAVAGQTADYNTALTRPTNPTKEGYTFDGWYKETGLINQWNFVTDLMPANNITLYAKWKGAEYQITYNLNGGTNSMNNPATYEFGTGVTTFENPTKEGYKFLGWFESATSNVEITNIGATEVGEKTLHARWEKIETAVNPDNNGTSGNNGTAGGAGIVEPTVTNSKKVVKTGDEINLLSVAVIMMSSAGYILIRKNRTKEENL